jgi:hypothetical protein
MYHASLQHNWTVQPVKNNRTRHSVEVSSVPRLEHDIKHISPAGSMGSSNDDMAKPDSQDTPFPR